MLYVLQGGNQHCSKYCWRGTLAGGPVVKNSPSNPGDMGSKPDRGLKSHPLQDN